MAAGLVDLPTNERGGCCGRRAAKKERSRGRAAPQPRHDRTRPGSSQGRLRAGPPGGTGQRGGAYSLSRNSDERRRVNSRAVVPVLRRQCVRDARVVWVGRATAFQVGVGEGGRAIWPAVPRGGRRDIHRTYILVRTRLWPLREVRVRCRNSSRRQERKRPNGRRASDRDPAQVKVMQTSAGRDSGHCRCTRLVAGLLCGLAKGCRKIVDGPSDSKSTGCPASSYMGRIHRGMRGPALHLHLRKPLREGHTADLPDLLISIQIAVSALETPAPFIYLICRTGSQ